MYMFLFDLAVVDWPWFRWDYSSTWVRTVILAMYTFIVGPWLPTSSAISEGLIHKLNHLMHWLQLCLLLHSSKLQKFHLFPYSCELEHLSKNMKNRILRMITYIIISPNIEGKTLYGFISSNRR